ncbi:MAG: hypothetical protein ACJ8DK_18995 [Microvirga sp.]
MLVLRRDDGAMHGPRADHRDALQGGDDVGDEGLTSIGRERIGGAQDGRKVIFAAEAGGHADSLLGKGVADTVAAKAAMSQAASRHPSAAMVCLTFKHIFGLDL